MKKINVWCSIHQPSIDQMVELGKVEFLPTELQTRINNTPASLEAIEELVIDVVEFLENKYGNRGYRIVQMGGSPMFLYTFGRLYRVKDAVTFAHSERVSEDQAQPDGTVKKISVFKHVKFF